jgi:hypothetical protein
MSSSRVRVAFFVLLLAVVLASGCDSVEVVDRSPAATSGLAVQSHQVIDEHNLAILAVDFDPPLNYEDIMASKSRGEGITLLVAVENIGVSTERNVVVRARLSERSSADVYVDKQGTIEAIAPGEIKIVHLNNADIPFSFEYTLEVSVLPIKGETRIGDNSKTYDLLVTQS